MTNSVRILVSNTASAEPSDRTFAHHRLHASFQQVPYSSAHGSLVNVALRVHTGPAPRVGAGIAARQYRQMRMRLRPLPNNMAVNRRDVDQGHGLSCCRGAEWTATTVAIQAMCALQPNCCSSIGPHACLNLVLQWVSSFRCGNQRTGRGRLRQHAVIHTTAPHQGPQICRSIAHMAGCPLQCTAT